MVQEENKLKREQINNQNRSIKLIMCEKIAKKSSPVHVAPACTGSGEGSDHLGSCTQPFPTFLQEVVSRT
jgi:hypothetical protein